MNWINQHQHEMNFILIFLVLMFWWLFGWIGLKIEKYKMLKWLKEH
jgi:hypothetical protein